MKLRIKEIVKKLGSYLFVEVALALIALIGILLSKNSIVINIACSILASSIVAILTTVLIYQQDEREKEVVHKWGMTNIYETRAIMNKACDEELFKAREHIDYIGFGFRSLREMRTKELTEKALNGVKIRFLVMNPDCPYLSERDKAEKATKNETRNSILALDDWVKEINSSSIKTKTPIELKFYNALPLDYYNRIDNVVYMGPYWYGRDSQRTISYKFTGDSLGFKIYTDYFESLWNNDKLTMRATTLEEDMQDLQDAIEGAKALKEGKERTYTLEEINKEYGL